MPLFEIATAAHLAGSVVLALFFVLLARHDPRPYLRTWTAAWIAQVLALAALLASTLRGWHTSLALFLFLQAVHGVLILAAAQNYARGQMPWLRHAVVLGLLAVGSGAAPWLLRDANALQAAQFAVLAGTYLASAATLWSLREPAGMGLRLTTNVLALLGLLHVAHVGAFAWTARGDAALTAYLEIAPFAILLLQMLLALGMVLAVMETAQWALAATNTQLKEVERRLKVLAETDPLTGCFNRRVFRDLVDDIRANQGVEAGVIVLLDLDGLKILNDRQGHAAGDDAIRNVAHAIRTRTRVTDIVVRWGGDEFVVVIPGATAAEGEGRRAQIVAAIAEANLSASAGLAIYGPEKDVMMAVQEADAAMYQAKAARKALGTAS
jgi:diguanylate cyclase (GGDEF)-like protein